MKLRKVLSHALMAWLFALGMALTTLSVTGLMADAWLSALLMAGLSLVCAAAGLDRRATLGLGVLSGFAGLVWLILGGASLCAEVLTALILHLSGLPTALPLVHVPFTVLLSALCLAAGWFVTQRSAGAYPALLLLVMLAVLIWLGNYPEAGVCLLPAVMACVTLILRAGDENTPTLHVIPLAAAVTAAAALCLFLGGVTFQPMKNFADDVRQRIFDTFFYTQPRDVFTLASEGYYPQGMSQLGGPATPREEPVMAVITGKKAYLRGVVKNVYTGRVWLDDIGGRRYLFSAASFDDERSQVFDQGLPLLGSNADSALLTPQLLQVRMISDSASTLFVPQRLRALSAEGQLIPYFNRSSEVFATDNLTLGDVWTAEAPLFTSMDAGVEALVLAADGPDPNWESVCDTYLQLHEQIDERVYEIAREAVYGADSDYAKALALQSYLAANYAYNLDVPEQNPNHDFVSSFLIEGKEGYCTYFASAMTVLCRMAGLPARYVEGYVAYPNEEGLAYVTGREGHAWTEVYFRNFGWVTFDATPTSAEYIPYMPPDAMDAPQEPESSPDAGEAPTPSPSPDPTPDPTPEESEAPAAPSPSGEPLTDDATPEEGKNPFPWGWLALLLLIAAAVRLILGLPQVQVLRCKSEFARWLVWLQATHDALARVGMRRGREESPAVFIRRTEMQGRLRTSMTGLAEAQNLMFYGHAVPYEEETRQVRRIFLSLYRELNPWQKVLFHLNRWAGRTAFSK